MKMKYRGEITSAFRARIKLIVHILVLVLNYFFYNLVRTSNFSLFFFIVQSVAKTMCRFPWLSERVTTYRTVAAKHNGATKIVRWSERYRRCWRCTDFNLRSLGKTVFNTIDGYAWWFNRRHVLAIFPTLNPCTTPLALWGLCRFECIWCPFAESFS